MQKYISSIEGTDTAVKEVTSRENDYSKHQQALLESDEEPSDGADTAVLKSAGNVVCIKHKRGNIVMGYSSKMCWSDRNAAHAYWKMTASSRSR